MITFPKIKAVSYAILKRLQGYHLLSNPKGTPQTEVNMIKTVHDGVNKAGLRVTINRRLKCTTDGSVNQNVEKRNIITQRIYDFKQKKFGKAQNADLWIKNNKNSKIYERNNYSYYSLGKLKEHSTSEMTGILKQIKEFNKKQIKRKNFFSVLYNNLTNKA